MVSYPFFACGLVVFFMPRYADVHMRTGFRSRPLAFSKLSIYFEVDHCGAIPPRRLSKLSCRFSRAHSIGKNMASTPVPEADVWVCSAPCRRLAIKMIDEN